MWKKKVPYKGKWKEKLKNLRSRGIFQANDKCLGSKYRRIVGEGTYTFWNGDTTFSPNYRSLQMR
jgi:hypothetical protein